MTPEAGRPGAVLFVCTGNVCRSPAAELLLRAGLGQGSGIEVSSAGLHALAGEAIPAPLAGLLRARGVEPSEHRGRQLETAMLREADLVLTMTAEQRSAVVRRLPAAVRRTFTLREFADLAPLAGVPETDIVGLTAVDRLVALSAALPAARARRPAGAQDDVDDPWGRPEAVHAAVLDVIGRAVAVMLTVLQRPWRPESILTHGHRHGAR